MCSFLGAVYCVQDFGGKSYTCVKQDRPIFHSDKK